MHEDQWDPLRYRRLAAIFEVSKRTIRDICAYRMRADTVMAWETVASKSGPECGAHIGSNNSYAQMLKKGVAMTIGRPTLLTPEMGDAICSRLINGESLALSLPR